MSFNAIRENKILVGRKWVGKNCLTSLTYFLCCFFIGQQIYKLYYVTPMVISDIRSKRD